MRRNLFNLVAGASLVLCVGMVVLWVRSYRQVDLFGREGRETADLWQRGGYASSGVGLLHVEWWLRQNGPSGSRSEPGWAYNSWAVRSTVPAQSWHGFRFEATSWNNSRPTSDGRATPKRMTYSHRVSAPHWFPVIIAGLVAVFLKPKPRWQLSLRELFTILTLTALGSAAIAALARVLG